MLVKAAVRWLRFCWADLSDRSDPTDPAPGRSGGAAGPARRQFAICNLQFAICTCICILLLAAFPASAAPLLETSFEEGEAGKTPQGWETIGSAPNTVALSTEKAHTGKMALHLVDTSTTLSIGLRSPKVAVKPEADYRVTWWFLAPEGKGSSLYLEFWDKDGTRIAGEGVHSFGGNATGKWERMIHGAAAPATAVHATVLANCWSGGTTDAFYDDIALVEGTAVLYDRTPLPPAAVKHPCGLYREADIRRAKENLRRHEWARKVLAGFRATADFWMQLPDDQIAAWIPDLTPIRVMDCPKCGANWDYAWQFQPDLTIKCTRCALVLPNADYPENGRETWVNPLGQKVENTFHQDAKGEKYRISGRLRYERIHRLNAAGALGKVYALTGEKAYAEKAVKVLRRLAAVYPGYVPHDWTRFYRDYSNLQSGKLSGWKLHDAGTFTQLATCYDLIYNSGCLTEEDKTLIENGAFREAVRLFTATSPRGCCINDGPYAMTCGALLGVVLGDHEAIRWATAPPDGFLGFVHRYFFRDGHWEDGSSSYENMALGPLYGCPEILQGYSDPPSYREADRFDNLDLRGDPILRKIFTAQPQILMPDGTAPAINDSASGTRFPVRHLETNYFWYPTEANRRILAHATGGRFEEGDEYALFRREPDASLAGVEPLNPAARSLVRPGLGLAILRAGQGPEAAALYLDYGPFCSGHGHPDKLNIIYYDDGAELIPDQGYLGARHEITPWNHATLCHNQVLIDGAPQARADGNLLAFQPEGPVQTVVAEAPAVYPGAPRYERTLSLVDHGPGRRYVVDVFRVAGGKTHDFAIHGAGQQFAAGEGAWQKVAEPVVTPAAGAKWIREATARETGETVRATWEEAGKGVALDLLGQAGTRVLHLAAPGLRNRRNPWEKREIHLLVARRDGPANTFVSVLRSHKLALTVSEVPVAAEKGEARAVRVQGPGFDDLLVMGEAAGAAGLTTCGDLRFRGQMAYLSRTDGKTTAGLLNGSELRAGALELNSTPQITGRILGVDPQAVTVTVDVPLPAGTAARGRHLILKGVTDGAYEIDSVALRAGGAVVTLAGEPVMDLRPGQEFTFSTFAKVSR